MLRFITALLLACSLVHADDDSLLEKVQIHGALAQGFLFSSSNNWFTADTSNGSARWTEGTINFGVPLTERLHAGIQFHSYSLGQIGQQKVTIDWAFGEYKVNSYLGIRAGKVKTPMGIFNDIQDVDSVYPWALLPQSVYPADQRSFHLAHTGFVLYGNIPLSKHFGSLSWQGYAGSRSEDPDEGYVFLLKSEGTILGDVSGNTYGGDIRWNPPVSGLFLGASYLKTDLKAPEAHTGGVASPGNFQYSTEDFYAEYEKGKLKLDAELNLEPSHEQYGSAPSVYNPSRIWYVMGTWRISDKLSAGAYHSWDLGFDGDSRDRHDPANYSRDVAVNTRYDFNSHFYLKLEGHFVSGTANGFYDVNNPRGLDRLSRLLAARVGFWF